jgi:hypothetical protein
LTSSAIAIHVSAWKPNGAKGVRKAEPQRRRLDKKEPKERECSIDEEEDEIEFQCKAKTENADTEIEDKIDFSVKRTNAQALRVKVKYEQEIEQGDTETETETEYEVTFDRLIEYEKANGANTEAYEWGSDTIVQTIALDSWSDFSNVVESEDGVVSTFSVSSTNRLAIFSFHISRAADGAEISANKMKIDFELINFPWSQDNTYVALISDIESQREVEIEVDDDPDTPDSESSRTATDVFISFQDATSTVGFVPFGEYTWAETAEVLNATSNATDTNTTVTLDSQEIQVVATSSSDPTSNEIAFSFIGDAARSAADIFWDPEAGISYSQSASIRAVASATCTIVAVLSSMLLMAI